MDGFISISSRCLVVGIDRFESPLRDNHGGDDGDVGIAVGKQRKKPAPNFPARGEHPCELVCQYAEEVEHHVIPNQFVFLITLSLRIPL